MVRTRTVSVRKPLSKGQARIWSYLLGYIADKGYAPTLQEIADYFRYENYGRQVIRDFLVKMAKKGYVRFTDTGWRNIEVITK